VLRELDDVACIHSILFLKVMVIRGGSQGLEESKCHPHFQEDLGSCRAVGLTSVPWKVIEQTLLEVVSKNVKDSKVSGSCQHGLVKRKSCLTKPTSFCEMTSLVDEGQQWMLLTLSLKRFLMLTLVTAS